MRPTVALGLALLAACGRDPGAAPRAPDAGAASQPTFSRDAFAPALGDAGAGDPPVPTAADPTALAELLAAASAHPGRPGPDRTALIGSDTGASGDAGAQGPSAPEPPGSSQIRVGKVTLEPGMSSPTIERAARAQLYWPLVQRCRDRDGAILPPEVVHLAFHLDRDGYVIPATILALPKDPRFADAARCMARELSMATFRAPAGARGLPHNVSTDVPSVD